MAETPQSESRSRVLDLDEGLTEQQLRHAWQMEVVGKLASGVGHEFNNLLFGILGSAQLLLTVPESELPDHIKGPLQDIIECGKRGVELTRQLREFAGTEGPNNSVFDLNQIVSESVATVGQIAGDQVVVETDLLSAPIPVDADRDVICNAVGNLARNAREAMPEGGKLTIRTELIDLSKVAISEGCPSRPGVYARLSVTDTGRGMAPETKDRMFEPFFSTKPAGSGFGMSLAILSAETARMRGFIEVTSQLGRGTEVCLHFPVAEKKGAEGFLKTEDTIEERVDPTALASLAIASGDESRNHNGLKTPPRAAGSVKDPRQRPMGGKETILVCDDDSVVLHSATALLASIGYAVLHAGSGDEAVEVASSHVGTIDLLLTDVTMPGMNGWRLAEILTVQRPDLKVIFLSGHPADVIEAGAGKSEPIEFIEKPPMDDTLVQRIRDVLDHSRGSAN